MNAPRFLVHRRGDHVGVAVADIATGERLEGAYLDSEELASVLSRAPIPLGHKIALDSLAAGDLVLEYGVPIGRAIVTIETGDHVHTHNLRSARW